MPFRTRYIALAGPAWPPTPARLNVIYSTIARAIRRPDVAQKAHVLQVLLQELLAFDANHHTHTATQVAFDTWHAHALGTLMAVPFNWNDARDDPHATLSLGAAQKFLNLGIKDWWAVAPNGTNPITHVEHLHGPLDQLVYACTARFRGRLPSLHNAEGMLHSYVYFLTAADYLTYQGHLADLGRQLAAALARPAPLMKIEVEQLLWGWV